MNSWSRLLRKVGLHHSFLPFYDDGDDDGAVVVVVVDDDDDDYVFISYIFIF